jgi:hypothetical protein
LRLLLDFLAGGEAISGDAIGGGVWVGGDAVGAVMVSGVVRAGASGATVAALPLPQRRRWQRLPDAAEVTAGAGMLHVTVRTWFLAAWLNTTCAFRPLAVHLS